MIEKCYSSCFTLIAGIAALAFTVGIAQAADPKPAGEDKVIATVNGTVLTNQDLDVFARAVAATRGQQMPKEEILNTLIDRELLYQEAVAKGYDKRPDVVRVLENQRRSLLANTTVAESFSAKPISEQDLRTFYKDAVLGQKRVEYKARHILVKTEDEAKDLISQLDKGADFGELAKAKSVDTSTGANGGELGWFNPAQMVPEFSAAAAALEKGKYTKQPVKSQFGWHVIVLDDTRPVAPPGFDEVKNQLEGAVQNQRIGEFLTALRQKAKIEVK